MLGDLYGLIPVNGRVVGVGGLCSVLLWWLPVHLTGSIGISLTWEEGSIGEIEVVLDNIELGSGIDKDVIGPGGGDWYPFTPSIIDARSLRCRRASRARVSQSESDEVPGQVCGCSGSCWIGGMTGRFMGGGAVHRKLENGESCSRSISMASFLNADLHLPRNVFFVSPTDEARVVVDC